MSFSTRKTRRSQLKCPKGSGLTEQHHKDSCDIKKIMHRYEKTGLINHTAQYAGQYMDLPSGLDYHEAQNVLAQARSMFETVPADIRNKFGNDPAQYLDFMQNPDNYQAIKDMGLDPSHLPEPAPAAPAAPDPTPEPTGEPAPA